MLSVSWIYKQIRWTVRRGSKGWTQMIKMTCLQKEEKHICEEDKATSGNSGLFFFPFSRRDLRGHFHTLLPQSRFLRLWFFLFPIPHKTRKDGQRIVFSLSSDLAKWGSCLHDYHSIHWFLRPPGKRWLGPPTMDWTFCKGILNNTFPTLDIHKGWYLDSSHPYFWSSKVFFKLPHVSEGPVYGAASDFCHKPHLAPKEETSRLLAESRYLST